VAAIAKAEGVTISPDRFDTLEDYMANITLCNGDPLVSGNHSRTASIDFFDSGFRQLSVDAVYVARRALNKFKTEKLT
jgi:hypothetical protein